jgi:hypothetical protein
MHARARRVSSDFFDRVLTVEDAVEWLIAEHEPRAVHLPLVEEVPAHAIELSDPIFDSLREGYPGFDKWWKEKCIAEHRLCWVVTIGSVLAGLVVRKDEVQLDTGVPVKTLKLCTFKVKPEFRGEKLGELLLKKALWFAQRNAYESIYLTTFPSQSFLIDVLSYFGFVQSGPDANGELRLEKSLSTMSLTATPDEDLYRLARLNYPRFVTPPRAPLFCVPIRGEYHDLLFPELEDRSQADLFEAAGLDASRPRTPGNTIRKIYLCKANTKQLEPGAIMLFYRSASKPSRLSQSITTVGVVERVSELFDADSLIRLTAKRSVYSPGQLGEMVKLSGRPIKAIDFLLVGHLAKPITLPSLIEARVFNNSPPQSIARLAPQCFSEIRPHLQFGFQV